MAHAEPDQAWGGAFLSGKPVEGGGRFLVWFDAHARYRDGGHDLDATILRPGVGYRVSAKLDVYAGYASITQYRPQGDLKEERLWQQALYPIAEFGGGKLAGRTRLEQRTRDGGDVGWRGRQFVRYARPVRGDFGAVATNEVFYSFNKTDWGQAAGYEQNRLFAGGYWQAAPKLRIELGYLNQHLDSGGGVKRDNVALNVFATF